MRHLLHVLLCIGRTEEERDALRGDLDETYATEIRPSRSWLGAQAWYAREILTAFACALRDNARVPRLRTGLSGDVRYASAQVTQSLLFGVSPSSPYVFGVTVLVLGVVALAASYLPARRASLADPITALRS